MNAKKTLCLALVLSIISPLFGTMTPVMAAVPTNYVLTNAIVGVDFSGTTGKPDTSGNNAPSNSNVILDGRVASGAFVNGNGNRHRLSFLSFDLKDYVNNIDDLESIKLGLYTNGDAASNTSSSKFEAYLLTPEHSQGINSTVIPTYGAAKNLGLIDDKETRIWAHTAGLATNTPYTSVNFADQIKSYFASEYFASNPDATNVGIKLVGTNHTAIFVNAGDANNDNDRPRRPHLQIQMLTPEVLINRANETILGMLPKFVAESVSLPAYIGNNTSTTITWQSLDTKYISHSGELVARPEINEGNKTVMLKATISNQGQSKDFTYNITILKRDSFIAAGIQSGSTSASVTFDTSSASSKVSGYILKIPNTYMEAEKEYILCANDDKKTEIKRFPPVVSGNYSTVVVSNYVSGNSSSFILTGTNGAVAQNIQDVFILEGFDDTVKSGIDTLENLDLGDLSKVTANIVLPTSVNGIDISWVSSKSIRLSNTGIVDRPYFDDGDAAVLLSAIFTKGSFTYSRTFSATVLKQEGGGASFPRLKDPQYITDQKFFGLWNTITNEWTTQPILQYDSYPALSTVEDFAKQGDYTKAKYALLTYYRGRYRAPDEKITWNLPTTTQADIGNYLQTDMLNERIFTFPEGADVIGKGNINSEWGWHTIDLRVTSTIRSALFLMDSDMNGSTVEIYSRRNNSTPPSPQGLSVPYLEVIENNIQKFLPAVADTYISAGVNRNTNYGNSDILYCREKEDISIPSQPLPVSADTKRPYFRFNTSSLTGNVSSMKLHFYARSDSPEQKVFAFSAPNEGSFDENAVTWIWEKQDGARNYTFAFNCKRTGWAFNMEPSAAGTGAPPNSVGLNTGGSLYASSDYRTWNTTYEWINSNTRLAPVAAMIARYRMKKEEKWAYNALEFLMSLYTQSGYRKNTGSDYPRVLEGGWRTEHLCNAFFGTLQSEAITPEILTAQLKYIYGHIPMLLTSSASGAQNQNSAARIGVLRLQSYFPEIRTPEQWTQAKIRLNEMYMIGFPSIPLPPFTNADGSYTEGTSGYMDGTVNELVQCLDMLTAYDGMDDPYYSKFMTYSYNGIIEYMLNMCLPYGLTPGWGDAGRGNLKGFLAGQIVKYDNPWVRYFTSGGAEGNAAPYTSKIYRDNGTIFMKDGWLSTNLGAFMGFLRGGSHGHGSALALDVSAYGTPLLVDAGNTSYTPSDPMARTVQKTLSHNTVEIKNYANTYNANSAPSGDQTNAGSLLDPQRGSLTTNKLFDFVVAGSGPGPIKIKDPKDPSKELNRAGSGAIYNGYDVNRKVLFLHNKYWIVNDYILPTDVNKPNTYSQAWHPNANDNGDSGSLSDINSAVAAQLYPSLTNPPAPINKITIDPKTKAMKTYLYGPNIQVVPADPEKLDARKLQYMQATPRFGAIYSNYVSYVQENKTGPVTFDTVLYPTRKGESTDITVQRINIPNTDPVTATALSIDLGGFNKGYYYTSNESVTTEHTFGDFSANCQMAYIETNSNNKTTMINLTNSLSLKKGNTELVSSDENLNDLGVQWSGSTLKLYTGDGTLPKNGVNIYSDTPINTVTLNDIQVNFSYSNNVITTKGDPYTPPPPKNPPLDPGPSGGSGKPKVGSPNGPNPLGPPSVVVPPVTTNPDETENPGTQTPEPSSEEIFTDISGHWAKDEILKMYEAGIVQGNKNGSFLPDAHITRAEFAAILKRALGIEPESSDKDVFADVSPDDWFATSIKAAHKAGIISGYGDGKFYPNNPISRQELAKMLTAACGYLGIKANKSVDINIYSDASEIADWAESAVTDATALGLLTGNPDQRFASLDNTTRAQAAVVASRLLDLKESAAPAKQ